jgi:beta-glucosidase
MTFPRAVGQVPIHYDHESTGRPPRTGGALLAETIADFTGPNNTDDYYTSKFLDLPLGPRFEFGHGLAYTTFTLDEFELSRNVIGVEESQAGIEAAVTVTNTGDRAGDDVVMLFVTDEVASVAQPVRRLRGFTRVRLEPGESVEVGFPIDVDDLRFWADGLHRVLEPGDFTLTISDGTVEHRLGVRLEESA